MDSIQQRVLQTIVSCETPQQIDVAIKYLENYIEQHSAEVMFFDGCQFLILCKIVELAKVA